MMDDKKKPAPDPAPKPLGNESTDPFSPAYPPGSLHEVLRQEEEEEVQRRQPPSEDESAEPGK
jgi:hypothetical protein